MLKVLMYKIIDRIFLAKCTWTGKSTNGRVKIAFKNFKNVHDFLYETIKEIDGDYSQAIFFAHMKTKILKHAYE